MDIIYISFLEAEVPRINPCSLCNFSLNRPLQLVTGGGFTNQDPTLNCKYDPRQFFSAFLPLLLLLLESWLERPFYAAPPSSRCCVLGTDSLDPKWHCSRSGGSRASLWREALLVPWSNQQKGWCGQTKVVSPALVSLFIAWFWSISARVLTENDFEKQLGYQVEISFREQVDKSKSQPDIKHFCTTVKPYFWVKNELSSSWVYLASRRALRAAQLLPDLRAWKGDLHPVGTRGTTLSGGQRARQGHGEDCWLQRSARYLTPPEASRNSEEAKLLTCAMTLCVKCAARSLGSNDYQLYQL